MEMEDPSERETIKHHNTIKLPGAVTQRYGTHWNSIKELYVNIEILVHFV